MMRLAALKDGSCAGAKATQPLLALGLTHAAH